MYFVFDANNEISMSNNKQIKLYCSNFCVKDTWTNCYLCYTDDTDDWYEITLLYNVDVKNNYIGTNSLQILMLKLHISG